MKYPVTGSKIHTHTVETERKQGGGERKERRKETDLHIKGVHYDPICNTEILERTGGI